MGTTITTLLDEVREAVRSIDNCSVALRDGYIRIRTPFLLYDGEVVDLYLDENLVLSDLGETVRWCRARTLADPAAAETSARINEMFSYRGMIEYHRGEIRIPHFNRARINGDITRLALTCAHVSQTLCDDGVPRRRGSRKKARPWRGLQVLKFPYQATWDLMGDTPPEDVDVTGEYGLHARIEPVFKRPGAYYNRITGECWVECPDGRAFTYTKRDFCLDRELLAAAERRLSDDERTAIAVLAYGNAVSPPVRHQLLDRLCAEDTHRFQRHRKVAFYKADCMVRRMSQENCIIHEVLPSVPVDG